MNTLYDLADVIYRFMNASPALLLSLLYLTIAAIPVTLVHELGHALAARRLLDADVEVTVGTTGKLAQMRLGQISVTLNALAHPTKPGGSARIDAARATALDVMLIALAGPSASLAGAVLTGWAFSATSTSGLPRDMLWAATLAGVFGVLNLIPLRLEEKRNGPAFRTDGRLALDALRIAHALRD